MSKFQDCLEQDLVEAFFSLSQTKSRKNKSTLLKEALSHIISLTVRIGLILESRPNEDTHTLALANSSLSRVN